ncbi:MULTISPECIES: DUF1127 domain-containing protein [Rhodobacterales]|uniref:DUF1127 domain-containing protein n=1 Tax=Rhodobacterales TaxID=204455 RepID=UPI00215D6137|nr:MULTISPECIES: DUF1127 domain-containing protein [Rhodobacterales]MDO6589889.1 DUF1127 domain-containing protein [Yoonia sp. 1_MG-2023]
MAYMNANPQTVAGNPVTRFISGAIADFKAASARRAVYRDVVVQLEGMTDRDLADIGIPRKTISAVATKAAYGNT